MINLVEGKIYRLEEPSWWSIVSYPKFWSDSSKDQNGDISFLSYRFFNLDEKILIVDSDVRFFHPKMSYSEWRAVIFNSLEDTSGFFEDRGFLFLNEKGRVCLGTYSELNNRSNIDLVEIGEK